MPEPQYTNANPGPCCQKIEDMILYSNDVIGKWPAYYKRTIGTVIYNEMLLMLRLVTKARTRHMNKSTLADLDTSKGTLEALLRVANRTVFTDKSGKQRRLLRDQNFGVWSDKLDEIGRLIGGWLNSAKRS
jgi:hypothetical protein